MNTINHEKLYTAVISNNASGENTIIAAPSSGQYIAIDHINLMPTTAVGVTLKSGSTALSGTYPLDALQSLVLDNAMQHDNGVITCADAEAFVINLSGAVLISGFVRYRIVNR